MVPVGPVPVVERPARAATRVPTVYASTTAIVAWIGVPENGRFREYELKVARWPMFQFPEPRRPDEGSTGDLQTPNTVSRRARKEDLCTSR